MNRTVARWRLLGSVAMPLTPATWPVHHVCSKLQKCELQRGKFQGGSAKQVGSWGRGMNQEIEGMLRACCLFRTKKNSISKNGLYLERSACALGRRRNILSTWQVLGGQGWAPRFFHLIRRFGAGSARGGLCCESWRYRDWAPIWASCREKRHVCTPRLRILALAVWQSIIVYNSL